MTHNDRLLKANIREGEALVKRAEFLEEIVRRQQKHAEALHQMIEQGMSDLKVLYAAIDDARERHRKLVANGKGVEA